MRRVIGLLVFSLMLVLVGFTVKALLWLAIVGLVMFVGTGLVAATLSTAHLPEQQGSASPMSSQPGRARLGRRRPVRVRGPAARRPVLGGDGDRGEGRKRRKAPGR